jgi:hypothetical protein
LTARLRINLAGRSSALYRARRSGAMASGGWQGF